MYRHNTLDIGFIAHPKTASTSLSRVLQKNGWSSKTGHHEIDEPIPAQVISVIREPHDWHVSWFFHVAPKSSFAEWLPVFLREAGWPYGRFDGLVHTTHLIFYKRLQVGFDAVMADLGLQPLELPFDNVKGRAGRPSDEFFTPELSELLDPALIASYAALEAQLGDQPYLELPCPAKAN